MDYFVDMTTHVPQGTPPETVDDIRAREAARARRGVIDYYESQRSGMTVTYQVLESRSLTDDLELGYIKADFAFPEGATLGVYLGVLAKRRDNGWRIVYYQASKL